MPPLFGIAYFRGQIFTLRHSPHRLMVHMFPYVLTLDPVHSVVRQFLYARTFSPYPVFQPRGISVGIPFPVEWLQPSFCRIYLYFTPHDLSSHDACRSIGGMVSGNMVPSFPSSVVKLRIYFVNLLLFTLLALIAELVALPRLFKYLTSQSIILIKGQINTASSFINRREPSFFHKSFVFPRVEGIIFPNKENIK